MLTFIRTIHEETVPDTENIIGVLLNEISDENVVSTEEFKSQSFVYIFKTTTKMYIFFNTMVDMIDYYFYGNEKCLRAYMKEDKFDEIYDETSFDGEFTEYLDWTN